MLNDDLFELFLNSASILFRSSTRAIERWMLDSVSDTEGAPVARHGLIAAFVVIRHHRCSMDIGVRTCIALINVRATCIALTQSTVASLSVNVDYRLLVLLGRDVEFYPSTSLLWHEFLFLGRFTRASRGVETTDVQN